jgi:tetratricopeptide (TPR) repeat protein
LFTEARIERESMGNANTLKIARWCEGRALRSLGRYEEALALQQELAEQNPDDGFVNEELGENLWALDRPDAARPHFAKAFAMLQDAGLDEARLARLRVRMI